MNTVITDICNLSPYLLIVGEVRNPKECFLIVDKKVVCEISCIEDIPFCLMSAFFVFNIHYPLGCNNFYTFMEVITLNYPLKKASITVKHFFAFLDM